MSSIRTPTTNAARTDGAGTDHAPTDLPALFRPIRIRGLEIRNRVWVPPLCQYSVTELDGVPHDWHLVHLGSMAAGGAGLVIAEATAVSPEGRISDHDTGLWNDEQAEAWARITRFIRSQGAASGIQLAHAGRKASVWQEHLRRPGSQPIEDGGWQTVAPSAIAFDGLREPVALDEDGILAVIEDFRAAARRAVDAGFDVVEVHAAHGYLLHQFLSPLSNRRTDAWGGSLAGRARLLLDTVDAVRAVLPDDRPLLVRVSATDWTEGGLTVEDTTEVAGWLRDAKRDLDFCRRRGRLREWPRALRIRWEQRRARAAGFKAGWAMHRTPLAT